MYNVINIYDTCMRPCTYDFFFTVLLYKTLFTQYFYFFFFTLIIKIVFKPLKKNFR